MPIIKDEKLRRKRNSYWNPITGAWERWKSSWENGTNPIRAALDSNLLSLVSGLSFIQSLYDANQTKENVKDLTKAIKDKDVVNSGLLGSSIILDIIGAKKAGSDLQERGRTALYRNKNPFGYRNNVRSDKTTAGELKDATLEFLNLGHLDTKGLPEYFSKIKETGDIRKLDVPVINLNGEARMDLRDVAYRKYLGLPERHEHIGVYVDNPDKKTVSYDIDKVNKIREKWNSGKVPTNFDFAKKNKAGAHSDYITSNGGNVDRVEEPDGSVYMVDTWGYKSSSR